MNDLQLINDRINNLVIDLELQKKLIIDILKNLGVDINDYAGFDFKDNPNNEEKELSNYRL